MVHILELVKTYSHGFPRKKVEALRGVTMTVPEGGSVGLIGPNGCGKTTLFKIMVGLLRPTAGTVRLFGLNPQDPDARVRLGYLPEHFRVPKYLTGQRVLETIGAMHGIPREALSLRRDELLRLCELEEWGRKETTRYSKGMLRKLGLAQTLIHDPEMLILDEPFEGLDPVARRTFCSILKERKKTGKTLIMSSHVLSDVEELCDQVQLMEAGRVISGVPLAELTRHRGFVILLPPDHPSLEDRKAILEYPIQRKDGKATILIPGNDALQAVLHALYLHKIPLLAVEPHRDRLEDYFFDTTGSDGA